MDLMKALQEVKRGDVIYFKDQTGRVNTCLVYEVSLEKKFPPETSVLIAGPDVRKHWKALDPRTLSIYLQYGIPVFKQEETGKVFNMPLPDWSEYWLPVEAERGLSSSISTSRKD